MGDKPCKFNNLKIRLFAFLEGTTAPQCFDCMSPHGERRPAKDETEPGTACFFSVRDGVLRDGANFFGGRRAFCALGRLTVRGSARNGRAGYCGVRVPALVVRFLWGRIAEELPAGWEIKNFELVLKMDVMGSKAGPPELIASTVW